MYYLKSKNLIPTNQSKQFTALVVCCNLLGCNSAQSGRSDFYPNNEGSIFPWSVSTKISH